MKVNKMKKILDVFEDDLDYTQIHQRINDTFSLYQLDKYSIEFFVSEKSISIKVYRKVDL